MKRILIIGNAGSGKTTFRNKYRKLLEEQENKKIIIFKSIISRLKEKM
jgi:GTPase SAR1 family protein